MILNNLIGLMVLLTFLAVPVQPARCTEPDCPIFGQGWPTVIWGLKFSPDRKVIASCSSNDEDVRLWDPQTGKVTARLDGHKRWAYTVAFSPDSHKLASGDLDGMVIVWDVRTKAKIYTLKAGSAVADVAFSPDGQILASAHDNHTIRLWDLGTGKSIVTLNGHTDEVWCAEFSPDGKKLCSGSLDETVRIWDVATGKLCATLKGHSEGIRKVKFSSDGKTVRSTSHDQTIRQWDVGSLKIRSTVSIKQPDGFIAMAFSADNKTLATSDEKRVLTLWDVATGKSKRTIKLEKGNSYALAFSPDGKRLATGVCNSMTINEIEMKSDK